MKKNKKKNRLKKLRGYGGKKRAFKIYDIDEQGFKFRVYNKEYYVSRDLYAWFLGATNEEILDVEFGVFRSEHGRFGLIWDTLDVWLASRDFDPLNRSLIRLCSNASRERYYSTTEKR
jgi:hypothetical protein